MQTPTSERRRGWSGQIASSPLSFFFLFFGYLGKATGRTVRPIWTNEGSKHVVPLKKVHFGGLNDVPLNFGGKIPQKLKFWGREGLLSLNEKKFKSLKLQNYLADHDKIFTGGTHHE